MTSKMTLAAIAAAILVAGGALAFSVGLMDRDHMDDVTSQGHMMGTMGATGPEWSGSSMQMGAMPGMAMGADGTMSMSDQAFLAMMIPHHQMALDMANVIRERGADPQVRTLAADIVAAQRDEIAEMTRSYRAWFGTEPPRIPMTGAMAMMGMHSDLDELRSTSEPDRTFLRMMIPHHAGAVLMATMTLDGSPRPEVADLARRMIAAQSTEIGAMQELRSRIAPPIG